MPCSRETCLMESNGKDARIASLESMVSDLNLRVEKLESAMAILSQSLPADTAQGIANRVLRADAPLYTPKRRSLAPYEQVPSPGKEQKLAPHEPNPVPSRDRKPVRSQAPTKPTNQNILYDAYGPKFMPSSPEAKHIIFIQKLYAAGTCKDEITQRALAEFPDMCGGRTEANRNIAVGNAVEMYTSRHAQKYI